MQNQIQIFSNPNLGEVRVSVTSNNEPFFCLADLCSALGIVNHRNVRTRLDDDDVRQMDATDNLGRTQQTTFVTESGMYDVVLRSDAPSAKPFRKWVTSEVLPAIRKSGSYSIDPTRYVPIEHYQALQRQANFDAERAQYWSQRSEYHLQMLIDQVKDNVRRLEARVASPAAPVWMTVAGYAALHHIPCSLSMAGGLGRKAAKLCLQAGITPDSIPDPRFGRVNTYPQNILQQVFETLI